MIRSLSLSRKTSGARLLAKKVAGVRGVGVGVRAKRKMSSVLVEHRLNQLEEVSKETIENVERLESSLDEKIDKAFAKVITKASDHWGLELEQLSKACFLLVLVSLLLGLDLSIR